MKLFREEEDNSPSFFCGKILSERRYHLIDLFKTHFEELKCIFFNGGIENV